MKWILLIVLFSLASFAQEVKPSILQGINFIQEGEVTKLIID